MTDKRIQQRVKANLIGRFKAAEGAGDYCETTIVNVSPEGLGFYSEKKLQDGQAFNLEVQLDQEKWIKLSGVVAWSNQKSASDPYRVGFKIVATGSEDERNLLDFYFEKVAEEKKFKGKILVIDDEKDLVTLLSFHLSQAGYEVVVAFDGEEGYQAYQDQTPDLIILDLKMPRLNGFEVCRKIRREKKDTQIPIIMLTALQDDADRLIGKVVGAQRYMTKPFQVEDLLKEVEWLMPTDFFMDPE